MDIQEIKNWIIGHLHSDAHDKIIHSSDMQALWGIKNTIDGKIYNVQIIYFINGKKHAEFLATDESLSDCIGFIREKNSDYDEKKLNRLVFDIVNNLEKTGRYKLKFDSAVNDFIITSIIKI